MWCRVKIFPCLFFPSDLLQMRDRNCWVCRAVAVLSTASTAAAAAAVVFISMACILIDVKMLEEIWAADPWFWDKNGAYE